MRSLQTILLLALVTLGTAWAAPDIEWIGALPGVHLTGSTAADGQQTRTYKISDPVSVYADLRQSLARRGWSITNSPQVSTGGVFVGTVVAVKGTSRLEITTHATKAHGGNMVVVMTGTGGSTTRIPEGNGPSAAAGAVTINDSNQHRTVDINGLLTINGSNNHLTVTGVCHHLTVNSSNNKIDVTGRVQGITVNGSNNRIRWSNAANRSAPAVQDNGSSNSTQGQ